jgi:hypothetical protein
MEEEATPEPTEAAYSDSTRIPWRRPIALLAYDEETGHAFRGNQYLSGESGGGQPASTGRAPGKTFGGTSPGRGYSSHAVLKNGVIHTNSVSDAARALYEGRKVELQQPRQLSTLIDHLGKVSQKMIELGGKAPVFDLCKVSVTGTNLFCGEARVEQRIEMPQLTDKQVGEFPGWLQSKGFAVHRGEEYAAYLRATQRELNGAKVAAAAARIRANPAAGDRPIIISKDNYILDGHHTWAAKIGLDAADNILADDKKMNVQRVDIDIIRLLHEADVFTGGAGHKSVADRRPFVDADWTEELHPRGEHGMWSSIGSDIEHPNLSSVKAARERGAWDISVRKVRDDWSEKRVELELKPRIPGGWLSVTRHGSTEYYDPKVAHVVEGNYVHPRNADAMTSLPETAAPDTLYRGMSFEEWEAAQKSGVIRSLGDYNIGEHEKGLTYYSTDPQQAQSYAHGFAPWPYKATPDRPAVVVAIRDPGGHVVAPTRPTEIGISDTVSVSAIKSVYFGRPYAVAPGYIEVVQPKSRAEPPHTGSGMAPDASLIWSEKRITAADLGWTEEAREAALLARHRAAEVKSYVASHKVTHTIGHFVDKKLHDVIGHTVEHSIKNQLVVVSRRRLFRLAAMAAAISTPACILLMSDARAQSDQTPAAEPSAPKKKKTKSKATTKTKKATPGSTTAPEANPPAAPKQQ